ncbi:sulfurtransferase [Kaistia terrae]|uniref:Sulfurtransferase n=1 Tax=Kaistia terrae TaxID=537017 RepID=A0ABW0PRC7_9HYPH|nr:sulfurtransferase [Kaistia terrae]MCX5578435.1 sulfurtransferase [Kaistia terrae]
MSRHDDLSTPTRAPLLVSGSWLADCLGSPDLRILDSTTRLVADAERGLDRPEGDIEGFEASHIPGAQFLDLQRDLSAANASLLFMAPDEAAFATAIARLGIGRDSHVVVYSRGNPWWATRVWWVFRLFGLDNVSILDGGWKNWIDEGRPVETGPSRQLSAGSAPRLQPRRMIATCETVLAAIGEPQRPIVNALPPANFSGASAPSKGRAGRIAGSVNLPAGELLDPQSGCFLPVAVLAKRLNVAGLSGKEGGIAYCGGGIAASAVAFSAVLAGLPEPLLYDASLQEWAADDSLPMETGPAANSVGS